MENESIKKVLTTSHLTVEERANLPDGKITASAATGVVREALQSEGWFPCKLFEGIIGEILEKKENAKYILHTMSDPEIERTLDASVLHKQEEYTDEAEAIGAYLRRRDGNLDGVQIDWEK